MAQTETTTTIRCDAPVVSIGTATIARLPETASLKLPSRGQVAVTGTINGSTFTTVMEPDGEAGHWLRIDPALQRAAAIHPGTKAALELNVQTDWPEPQVPKDLATALAASPPSVRDLWKSITPMSRWEWVRWVAATPNPETRRRRVEVTISKMTSGSRRPCCFNRAACTDPDLSRNGRLIDPT